MAHPRLIALTGRAQSGKDTVRAYLEQNHGYVGLAFADPIRELRAKFLSMAGADNRYNTDESLKQTEIPELGVSRRVIEQTLGTEWGRDCIRQDLWLHLLKQKIQAIWAKSPDTRIVVSDLRFLNEESVLRDLGAEVWRMVRDSHAPVDLNHKSEAEMAFIVADATIANTGSLENLRQQIALLLRSSRHNNKG